MLLSPVISKLAGKRVVLASASPRRQDILSNVGLRFEVVPSWFKETLDKSSFSAPYEYAVETAKQKALEVARRMHVTLEDTILEKPFDKQDAYNMLSRLSGKEHSVFTGVVIVHCRSQKDNHLETDIIDFYEETKVKFAVLSEDLLREYIDSGEPMDKAGGYGIQSLGGMLVESVHGDFLNVVGFPLNHFCKKLAELYYPPHKHAVHRVKHDSIPYVESFENLSDVEKDCSFTNKTCESKKGEQDRVCKANSPGSSIPCKAGLHNGIKERPKHCAQKLSKLTDLIDGFKASKTLFAASKLKVFDKLKDKGALKAMEIADKINASVHGTERLLDACVALGLLEKTHQVYSNTELANTYLVSDAEFSVHEYILFSNDHTWSHFTHLESTIVEGGSHHHHHHQAGHKTCDKGPEFKERFMRVIHCTLKIAAGDIVTAFDLSKYSSACDLGGCTGAIAHELVWTYPEMKVNVYDLPEVIKHSSKFQPDGCDSSRVTFTSGNFLEDPLPEADLYILSRILHDLPEGNLNLLLKKVSAACCPGRSAVLIAEIVLDEDMKEPRGLLQSLNMGDGKQRSGTEYKKLLENHGFNCVQIRSTGNLLDAILAVKR
ncbi:putative bifunctional dTTP/UTP pyrophosphatase/methyltransferase protein isoform 2-T2 [Anomaloglossus baeobatrachus]|uniref:putative bifunctional dTTP/UTP pyrophosphatase/methyltransferase protein isoform X2 n=1 Tax=Anomaloglossus baeobatrachus TaxID=238106 RepID=UPI003F503568